MIYLYLVIAILIIIILFIFNYYLNHNIESFKANTVYSKNYILDNCEHSWAKINNSTRSACNNEAWVSKPRYLCGICGNDNIPLISLPPAKGSKDPILYGCNTGQKNSLGLNWNNSSSTTLSNCDGFLSDLLTCNKMNKQSTADMYLFIQSTSTPNINVKGLTGQSINVSFLGESYYYCYYYQNVTYNTLFNITVSGMSQGFGISYMWNKQLFILDNNGYKNCANIIKYDLNAKHLWGNTKNGYPDSGMLPWMKNWLIMDMNIENPNSNLTIQFNIGHTKEVGTMNNDLVAWVGVCNFGEVLANGVNQYGDLNNLWGNSVIELTVPNISNNNTISINTQSAGFLDTFLSLTYVWHGIVFSFPSSLNGFNNVIQPLSWGSFNYTDYSTNVKYCNLPINYTEDSGPCGACDSNNYCILEQTYYAACNTVTPSKNLLFNNYWIYKNNSTAPSCECCACCDDTECSNCCYTMYVCQQMSNMTYTSTVSDEIFTLPDNLYV